MGKKTMGKYSQCLAEKRVLNAALISEKHCESMRPAEGNMSDDLNSICWIELFGVRKIQAPARR